MHASDVSAVVIVVYQHDNLMQTYCCSLSLSPAAEFWLPDIEPSMIPPYYLKPD